MSSSREGNGGPVKGFLPGWGLLPLCFSRTYIASMPLFTFAIVTVHTCWIAFYVTLTHVINRFLNHSLLTVTLFFTDITLPSKSLFTDVTFPTKYVTTNQSTLKTCWQPTECNSADKASHKRRTTWRRDEFWEGKWRQSHNHSVWEEKTGQSFSGDIARQHSQHAGGA